MYSSVEMGYHWREEGSMGLFKRRGGPGEYSTQWIPTIQKDEIEEMVKEMLEAEII